MDETWSNLLSGIVGALVGGAASLAGTVLVNRMQMAAGARLRIYDDLLPKFRHAVDEYLELPPSGALQSINTAAAEQATEVLAALRRAAAIAGGHERHYAERLNDRWRSFQRSAIGFTGAPIPPALYDDPGPRAYLETTDYVGSKRFLEQAMDTFSEYLRAKLG
jgi:hypothetical protein